MYGLDLHVPTWYLYYIHVATCQTQILLYSHGEQTHRNERATLHYESCIPYTCREFKLVLLSPDDGYIGHRTESSHI